MHSSCIRTGFKICASRALSPHIRKKNSFHKLIRVIRIFIRKVLWLSAIHEIFLTSNYFQTTVPLKCHFKSMKDIPSKACSQDICENYNLGLATSALRL